MRRPEWKQANPRDQITVILMAAQWHLENISSGITPPEALQERCGRVKELLSQAQELTKMVSGEWPM